MDVQVAGKKLGLKERYALMTRGLDWQTTYQPMDKVYPMAAYEGIKIHDWDKWEDPFRLTMDAYWKYQSEKERKLYAIIDAYTQGNGHLSLTDGRYLNAVKIFLQGISPLEYLAHRGYAHIGRQYAGAGARVACLMQSIDELRHAQTQIHSMSNYNKYYNGFHSFLDSQNKVWLYTVPRSFFEDALSAGPFEYIIAISFSFEYLLTNLLFVPFVSGAAYNGDMAAMTFGFSAQSDEARHMTLGIESIKFLLEQDPANVPIVQKWIDKWAWRGARLLTVVGMMMDYYLPKRVMSWKEAWEVYYEQNGGALFNDLARYGIRVPKCHEIVAIEKEHVSHQIMATVYQYNKVAPFHSWLPSAEEMDWLSAKYPNTFDKYYRPRFEHWAKLEAAGTPFNNTTLPCLCTTCQIPMVFTEPDDPTQICYRQSEFRGEKFSFCSDGCKDIFDDEPEKYCQSWLPPQAIYRGECFPEGTDPTAPDFNPIAKVLEYYKITPGVDNGTYNGSPDEQHFNEWRELATRNI